MPNNDYILKNLLSDAIDLYVKGSLIQYGLNDSQALEIVSNLTHLPKEKLVELKRERIERLSASMTMPPKDFINILGVGR